ncbi:hypothetical protein [Salibacterium lacus]|uniref:Uncharacterized protein n=1 Tax=Salibacterium lacus TaxID=1898109 RepID=A0ABW5SZC7_9BACI
MSVWYKISRIFKPREETSEEPKHQGLKTRYYAATFNRIFRNLEQLPETSGKISKVIKADQERGELFLEAAEGRDRFDVIITIVQVGPNETAVDIVSSIQKKSGDRGKNYPVIQHVLQKLDQSFPSIKKTK